MDPAYEPSDIETRQVYGISLQQRRNDIKIDASLFKNIVTQNKDASRPYSMTSPLTHSSPSLPSPT